MCSHSKTRWEFFLVKLRVCALALLIVLIELLTNDELPIELEQLFDDEADDLVVIVVVLDDFVSSFVSSDEYEV